MSQNNNDRISHALIETFVRKKLAELKKDPARSTRNLVDMALNFSEGRFQKQFFGIAQTMLQNEGSGYYRLIQDIVTHVDTERLLTFGMNLGYNSFTSGAKIIRETEAARGFNIPWTIILHADNDKNMEESRNSLIEQGKVIGIRTFVIYADAEPENLLPLIGNHTDCAFVMLCKASDMTGRFIDEAAGYLNLMLAVEYSEKTSEICGILRKRRMLYSVYVNHKAENTDAILAGDLLGDIGELHPVFTLFVPAEAPDGEVPQKVQSPVYDYIMSVRAGQNYYTAPFDLWFDSRKIDSIISDDACAVSFDAMGNFYREFSGVTDTRYNYRYMKLADILKDCCGKRRNI